MLVKQNEVATFSWDAKKKCHEILSTVLPKKFQKDQISNHQEHSILTSVSFKTLLFKNINRQRVRVSCYWNGILGRDPEGRSPSRPSAWSYNGQWTGQGWPVGLGKSIKYYIVINNYWVFYLYHNGVFATNTCCHRRRQMPFLMQTNNQTNNILQGRLKSSDRPFNINVEVRFFMKQSNLHMNTKKTELE